MEKVLDKGMENLLDKVLENVLTASRQSGNLSPRVASCWGFISTMMTRSRLSVAILTIHYFKILI